MYGAVRVGVSPADAALLAQRGVPAAWNGAATYTLSPEEAIKGGVILYGPEYDVDLTYEALIAAVFESHEKEIAECLFRSGS